LNLRVRRLLPFVDLRYSTPGAVSVVPTYSKHAFATSLASCGCIESSSLGYRIGVLRGLLFTRTKFRFWDELITATTTYTELSADEYENPPDIPTIKINRIRAGEHRLLGLPPQDRLRRSVFGQLMFDANMHQWDPVRLRRSYSHIQDAGQKRCFFVKFVSEGVDDHGGPYRAVFQLAAEEEPAGSLHILVPSPNADGAMQNSDKMMFATHDYGGDEAKMKKNVENIPDDGKSASQEQDGASGNLQCANFFGKLVGIATRHEINVALNLPALVWRPLTGLPVGWKELHEIDSFTTLSLRQIEILSKEEWESSADVWSEVILSKLPPSKITKLGIVTTSDAAAADESIVIPYELRLQCVEYIVEESLKKGSKYLEEFTKGLADVLPVEAFTIFTPTELETLICGEPEIDVELLKRATVYEDVDENAPHVGYFWEALKEMTQEQLAKFINFVCARSRLPSSVDKFPMNFKIQPATSVKEGDDDTALPKSQTCFFSLALPKYSSKDICLAKILYAADNCNTMEDYDEHEAGGFALLNTE